MFVAPFVSVFGDRFKFAFWNIIVLCIGFRGFNAIVAGIRIRIFGYLKIGPTAGSRGRRAPHSPPSLHALSPRRVARFFFATLGHAVMLSEERKQSANQWLTSNLLTRTPRELNMLKKTHMC